MLVWRHHQKDTEGHEHQACSEHCLLEMVNVSYSYRHTPVLHNVNIHVHMHEIVALVGDNGAGKSTIAKLAVGEKAPDSGRVELFCENPQHFSAWQHVGYVSQLVPGAVQGFPASVLELVMESEYAGLFSRKRLSAAVRKERARQALERVGMLGYEKRLLRELSGGQLQRVRLAAAMVGNPELLVLDEPTTGLDKTARDEFYALVAQAHETSNVAVLMVTHDLSALQTLNCRVLEVSEGTVRPISVSQVSELGE